MFALLFIVAGIAHFVNTSFFISIMPPYLPFHLELVYISGVVEVILGALLVTKKFKTVAGWGIVGLLIAVSPANIHMAMNPKLYPQFPEMALYIRLVVQVMLIAWAYSYTKK